MHEVYSVHQQHAVCFAALHHGGRLGVRETNRLLNQYVLLCARCLGDPLCMQLPRGRLNF
eukprot:SAG11_NODE_2474_length_3317_cov_2.656930_3_plen_60_part_00